MFIYMLFCHFSLVWIWRKTAWPSRESERLPRRPSVSCHRHCRYACITWRIDSCPGRVFKKGEVLENPKHTLLHFTSPWYCVPSLKKIQSFNAKHIWMYYTTKLNKKHSPGLTFISPIFWFKMGICTSQLLLTLRSRNKVKRRNYCSRWKCFERMISQYQTGLPVHLTVLRLWVQLCMLSQCFLLFPPSFPKHPG